MGGSVTLDHHPAVPVKNPAQLATGCSHCTFRAPCINLQPGHHQQQLLLYMHHAVATACE